MEMIIILYVIYGEENEITFNVFCSDEKNEETVANVLVAILSKTFILIIFTDFAKHGVFLFIKRLTVSIKGHSRVWEKA